MSLLGVGAEDGEDGGLLARLGQQLVDQNLPLGEAELRPRLALVGAEPGGVGRRTVVIQPPSPPPRPRLDLLEVGGGAALRDGHQDAAVVAPRVEVGARQRLGGAERTSALAEPSQHNAANGHLARDAVPRPDSQLDATRQRRLALSSRPQEDESASSRNSPNEAFPPQAKPPCSHQPNEPTGETGGAVANTMLTHH